MGNHLALAGLPHSVALHSLGEDHRRLACMLERRRVGGIYFKRVMTAASQRPNLVVGPVFPQLSSLRVLAEELLTHIGAVLGFEVLILAVDTFLHAFVQQA